MIRVDFHSQVGDKILYACRLIRKARAANCKLIVLLDNEAQATELDQSLWDFTSTDFLPHVMINDVRAAQTAIVLTESLQCALPHNEILLNLSQSMPEGYSAFSRVIEIVSSQEQDAQAGRQRFRHYQQQGIKPSHTVATTL